MVYARVTATWQGTTGLPGYTRMKCDGLVMPQAAQGLADSMRTFFDTIKTYIPQDVTISWDGLAQMFSDNGQLIGEYSYTPPAQVVGANVQSYASPTGAVVNWLTNDFVNGRRVRGRTFLVPLGANAYATDGTLAPAAQTAIQTAAVSLVGAPSSLLIATGQPAAGTLHEVTGASVPDRAAILRSRRD